MSAPAAADAVTVTVWSDYVCPFCYLALPTLDRLQAEEGVAIEWRAYELRPEPAPLADYSDPRIRQAWEQAVLPMAEERGLTLRRPSGPIRSRRAHEAAFVAEAAGFGDPYRRALFRARWEDDRRIDEDATLIALAAEVGIPEDAFAPALTQGHALRAVLEDEAVAARLGVTGVPAMLVRVGPRGGFVTGAQPLEVLKSAVAQVRAQAGA